MNKNLRIIFAFTQQVFQLIGPKTLLFYFILFVTAAPIAHHRESVPIRNSLCVWAVGRCHPGYWSICSTLRERAALLFTRLPVMLHRGLIKSVDRSCNLKRGHCSSEQKQLKENERWPLWVKNRKLSTCMLDSTIPPSTAPPAPAPTPLKTYWACIVMYDQICQFFL